MVVQKVDRLSARIQQLDIAARDAVSVDMLPHAGKPVWPYNSDRWGKSGMERTCDTELPAQITQIRVAESKKSRPSGQGRIGGGGSVLDGSRFSRFGEPNERVRTFLRQVFGRSVRESAPRPVKEWLRLAGPLGRGPRGRGS